MNDPRDAFVIHRLRAKPVEYTVKISHFVQDGEWTMAITVLDLDDDQETKSRLAADLRVAADWLENGATIKQARSQNRQPVNADDASSE
jgi:hypothetical protein